jgi:hypothetical protein
MSLLYDSLRAFAAGGAARCVLYAATAYSVEARITIHKAAELRVAMV